VEVSTISKSIAFADLLKACAQLTFSKHKASHDGAIVHSVDDTVQPDEDEQVIHLLVERTRDFVLTQIPASNAKNQGNRSVGFRDSQGSVYRGLKTLELPFPYLVLCYLKFAVLRARFH
jgi:hypothetical protein